MNGITTKNNNNNNNDIIVVENNNIDNSSNEKSPILKESTEMIDEEYLKTLIDQHRNAQITTDCITVSSPSPVLRNKNDNTNNKQQQQQSNSNNTSPQLTSSNSNSPVLNTSSSNLNLSSSTSSTFRSSRNRLNNSANGNGGTSVDEDGNGVKIYFGKLSSNSLPDKTVVYSKANNRRYLIKDIIAMLKDPQLGLPIKDRYSGFQYQKQCFNGFEMVDWLISHDICANRHIATQLGQYLLDKSIIRHIYCDQPFKDLNQLYCFKDFLGISDDQIYSLVQLMKKENTGVQRMDRSKLFKKYKDCFIGSEAVDWLLKNHPNYATNREESIKLCQEIMNLGLIVSASNTKDVFKDDKTFYVFRNIIFGGYLGKKKKATNERKIKWFALKEDGGNILWYSNSPKDPFTHKGIDLSNAYIRECRCNGGSECFEIVSYQRIFCLKCSNLNFLKIWAEILSLHTTAISDENSLFDEAEDNIQIDSVKQSEIFFESFNSMNVSTSPGNQPHNHHHHHHHNHNHNHHDQNHHNQPHHHHHHSHNHNHHHNHHHNQNGNSDNNTSNLLQSVDSMISISSSSSIVNANGDIYSETSSPPYTSARNSPSSLTNTLEDSIGNNISHNNSINNSNSSSQENLNNNDQNNNSIDNNNNSINIRMENSSISTPPLSSLKEDDDDEDIEDEDGIEDNLDLDIEDIIDSLDIDENHINNNNNNNNIENTNISSNNSNNSDNIDSIENNVHLIKSITSTITDTDTTTTTTNDTLNTKLDEITLTTSTYDISSSSEKPIE